MKPDIKYEIVYSSRKTLALQIKPDGSITVRAPQNYPVAQICSFVTEKENWIQKHLTQIANTPCVSEPPFSTAEKERYISLAKEIILHKVIYYARIMNVDFKRITLREQKTRWGSCSASGSLNFNWRLILAPEDVLDYVIVHELAHRTEMNHSKAFYTIIENILPDYEKSLKWLKDNGKTLWARS